MKNTFRDIVFKIPLLKHYGQLIEVVQQRVRINKIKKSNLINYQPDEHFIQQCLQSNSYLYLPWIKALTNKLIETIDQSDKIQFIPLKIFSESNDLLNRKKINYFANYCPQDLSQILFNWLKPVASHLKGFILTFDYTLLQREIIKTCAELNILTILIPHESVFLNRDKYYFNPITGANAPLCDYVLCWGDLQKDIFVSRGYPEKRIKIVGAPKFDRHYHFQAKLSRAEFCSIALLNPQKKIILYAAQTLDFQVNQKAALRHQRQIIKQLINYASNNQLGFVLRCPPTQIKIVDSLTLKEMKNLHFLVDGANNSYRFEAEEAIYHADVIVSINSTMLFEALLMGRKAISVKYFDFEEYWKHAGVPYAHNETELTSLLDEYLNPQNPQIIEITEWARKSFTPKHFDGQASARILTFLENNAENCFPKLPCSSERLINDDSPGIDMVYFPKIKKNLTYLAQLINAKKIITNKEKFLIPRVDCSLQWDSHDASGRVTGKTGQTQIYIKQGLIKATSPWLSIIIDDEAYYYEADKMPRLQLLLNSSQELSLEQEQYAQLCIRKIVRKKFAIKPSSLTQSKIIGRAGYKKIVLIDQYIADPAVNKGMANEENFCTMLEEAINNYANHDILIYLPATPLIKQKKSYLNKEFLLPYLKKYPHIFILGQHTIADIFSQVEQFFVVSSLLGFEALLAGKKVTCYGMPFYANRGLTTDKIRISTRTRERRVIDIFYFAYITLSRYYSPNLQRKCRLDEFLDTVKIVASK